MNTLETAVEFVEKQLPQPPITPVSGSAATSDFMWLIISLAVLVAIATVVLIVRKSKKAIPLCLMSVMMLCLSLGFGIASASEQSNMSAPDKIQALVDTENKTVEIPKTYLENSDIHTFKMTSLELEKVADKGEDKWQINDWYDDVAGKTVDMDLFFKLGDKTDVEFKTESDYETCKKLIGKTAVVAKYNFIKETFYSGICKDRFDKGLQGATVKLFDENGKEVESITTPEDGSFLFKQYCGFKGSIIASYEGKNTETIPDVEFTNEDQVHDILLRDFSKEPKVLDTKTYNRAEQVGVEGDDSIELRSYSAKDAGKHTAIARPAYGCLWPNKTTEEKPYDWYINKANPNITCPHNYDEEKAAYEVSANGVTALKTFRYDGEINELSDVTISFIDSHISLKEKTGTPQECEVSLQCTDISGVESVDGTISFAECNNFNAATAQFKIKIVPEVKFNGVVSKSKSEDRGHAPSTKTEGLEVCFNYFDNDGYLVKLKTFTGVGATYNFKGIPLGSTGKVSCNEFGYFGIQEKTLDEDQKIDFQMMGPELDNYTVEDLAKASDLISDGNADFKDEFNRYIENDDTWFSQSNCQQCDDAKKGYYAMANTALCNQDYKCDFEIDEGKIVPEDREICRFMFLRVIGLTQDNDANADGTLVGKQAGLTFQTVCSLPKGYAFHQDEGINVSWWGDSSNDLRGDINKADGKIFTRLADAYKNNILTVQKKSQINSKQIKGTEIGFTGDKMFPLSYTEMCTSGTEYYENDYYRNSAEGEQYKWYARNDDHKIKGNAKNEELEDLGRANCDTPMGLQSQIAIGRSPYSYSGDMQQYLTINDQGLIYSYNRNFSDNNGFAPAFSLGSLSGTKHISLQGENITYEDYDGKELSTSRNTTSDKIEFKIVPKRGLVVDKVTVNGAPIQIPESGQFSIPITDDETIIKTTTIGESADAPYFTGSANVVKHIGDDKEAVPYADNTIAFYLDGQFTPLAETIIDEDGSYRLDLLNSDLVGKTGYLKIDARPGVNAYQSQKITIKLDKNEFNPEIWGLDYYTFEELSKVGDWLNAHENDSSLKNSNIYKEFDSYIVNNCVWYSNSNGKQPLYVDDTNPNAVKAELCNQNYRCFFDGAADNSQFFFLRVMDILHDELSSGNGHAGLTFQTVHSIPVKTVFDGLWWGDCKLRAKLQRNGEIFNKISACNMTDYMVNVNKYSQADRGVAANLKTSSDKLFLLSYSEIWAVNGAMTQNRSWYGNNGNGTEGHVYKWYFSHNIDGSKSNNAILHMHWNNNNIQVGEKGATWERSVYYDNDAYSMLIREGAPNSWNFDTSGEGLAPAFCLGGK